MLLNLAETRLSNGIRVATAEMPGVESLSMGVWVGVGGRYEAKRLSGVSHFIEHLLFKGTKTLSARDISQAIEGRGGYFNAYTQEETTCYYARVSANHSREVFAILADMYLNPRFAAADIHKERGVIIEEIMMYKDQPQHLIQEILGELLWVDHPVGRPLIGTAENIRRMRRKEILEFKARKYVPKNTLVVFAGKLAHGACVKQVEELLGDIRSRENPGFEEVSGQTRQKSIAVLSKDIEQTHIAMGVRLFGRDDKRRYALKLMSIVLGENMSSRLFQEVREKHGLAYSIHSGAQLLADTGALDVQAGIDTHRIPKALELIIRELVRLKEKPVGSRELRRAKDYAIGQMRIGLESPANQMMWVGENIMSYGRLIQPREVIKEVEAVSERDIHNVANDVLNKRRFSMVLITPGGGEKHAEMMRRTMARL